MRHPKGGSQRSTSKRKNTIRKAIASIRKGHKMTRVKKQYKQWKEKKQGNVKSGKTMTRAWIMPVILAVICSTVLVYSCLIGQPAFVGDLSLKGDTVETLTKMTSRITGSLDVISLMRRRDKCDPIAYLVDIGFKLIIETLNGGIIDELKMVLKKVNNAFDIISNIKLDKLSFLFTLPPLLGCLMFLLGFLVTLLPLSVNKKAALLGTIERQIIMFASLSLIFYMTITELFLALVRGVPLINLTITNGPLVQIGLLVSFVLILAFAKLKISQLIPVEL